MPHVPHTSCAIVILTSRVHAPLCKHEGGMVDLNICKCCKITSWPEIPDKMAEFELAQRYAAFF